MTGLADLGAGELLELYRRREASPEEVAEACAARIEQLEPALNAVTTRCPEVWSRQAAEATRRWRSGEARPLEGVPYGVKDLIHTAGVRTTGGSRRYRDYVPETGAEAVDRLERAGGVMMAKLHTFEFARGDDSFLGPTRNPWDLERTAGASSTGAGAVLAARQLPLALATDTGGSIRVPATFCGVTGLKPTFGLVPRTGVMPQSWTLDHVGPMGRSVADVARMLTAIAGYDPADPESIRTPRRDFVEGLDRGVAGLRLGIPRDWFFDVIDPEALQATQRAASLLAGQGADVVEVDLPHAHLSDVIGALIIYAEFAALHTDDLDRLEEFGTRWTQQVLVDSHFVGAADYLRALRARHLIQRDLEQAFEQADVLLVPGTVGVAPRLEDLAFSVGDAVREWDQHVARMTLLFNLAGVPALALPAGFSSGGLPLGIQVAARPFDEATCLRVGHTLQRCTTYHLAVPPLVSGQDGMRSG
ncbi:MAG TPA: amidase [Actinomycetes bacterium]|nr:amidase [Actinomycetes bacterium]